MTIAEAKDRLPDVPVRCYANMVVMAQTSGRLNPFATVTLPRSRDGRQESYQFSWRSVALSATHAIPLSV